MDVTNKRVESMTRQGLGSKEISNVGRGDGRGNQRQEVHWMEVVIGN